MEADLVLRAGGVFLGGATGGVLKGGCVGVADGRICYVGTDPEACIGPNTQVVDVRDALVTPGLIDSHVHFFHSALYRSRFAVFCEGTCPEDCVAALAAVEDVRPRDEFMLCYGWRHTAWAKKELPTRRILDEAYPDRPVVMHSGDAHALWCNGPALAKLGITPDSVPPEGGVYQRDENGQLTGIIQESAATMLIPRVMDFSNAEAEEAIRDFQRDLNANGITGVGDCSMMMVPGGDFVRDDLYAALEAAGDLTVRISMFPTALEDLSRARDLRERFAGPGHDRVRMAGLKQFMDGVSQTYTAWELEDYASSPTPNHGRPSIDPERMRRIVLAANAEGFPVRVHCIGDRAVRHLVDVYEESALIRRSKGLEPLRNGIEHLECVQPADIARMAELKICANVQPPHATQDPDDYERDLGRVRSSLMWPFARYVEAGVPMSFGTDSPVVDINTRNVLYDAVTRTDAVTGHPAGGWHPEYRVSGLAALRAYTYGSAYALGVEKSLGSLAPGMRADIAVLSRDVTACDPEEILRTDVLRTYVGGRLAFEA